MDNYYKFRKKLGEKVLELREAEGFTQQYLALEIGVDTSFIGRIEKAERVASVETVLKLAEAFKLKPSEFIAEIEKGLPDDFSLIDV